MTNASFTDKQIIASTPLALILSALATKPGKCAALQVGVNAPGTADHNLLICRKLTNIQIFGPFSPITLTATLGGASLDQVPYLLRYRWITGAPGLQ